MAENGEILYKESNENLHNRKTVDIYIFFFGLSFLYVFTLIIIGAYIANPNPINGFWVITLISLTIFSTIVFFDVLKQRKKLTKLIITDKGFKSPTNHNVYVPLIKIEKAKFKPYFSKYIVILNYKNWESKPILYYPVINKDAFELIKVFESQDIKIEI